jgi:hypothetical protein
MGREIKRVALDFDWPLGKVWEGYLMPDSLRSKPCPDCDNGYTAAGAWLMTFAWRLTMLADDVEREQPRGRALHPWLANDQYPPMWRDRTLPIKQQFYSQYVVRPSVDIVDLVNGLQESSGRTFRPGIFGRSTSDAYCVASAIAKAAGMDEDWGICKTCGGSASLEDYPGQAADQDAWEGTEPPSGEGWQVWETVSEGSPISPVFPDRESLVEWLTSPAYSWGTSEPLTHAQAERFVDSMWAPTGVVIGGEVINGDEWVGSTLAD